MPESEQKFPIYATNSSYSDPQLCGFYTLRDIHTAGGSGKNMVVYALPEPVRQLSDEAIAGALPAGKVTVIYSKYDQSVPIEGSVEIDSNAVYHDTLPYDKRKPNHINVREALSVGFPAAPAALRADLTSRNESRGSEQFNPLYAIVRALAENYLTANKDAMDNMFHDFLTLETVSAQAAAPPKDKTEVRHASGLRVFRETGAA